MMPIVYVLRFSRPGASFPLFMKLHYGSEL